MLEETCEVLEVAHGTHEFLEVVEAALRLRALVVLPHLGVAGLVQNDFRQFRVGQPLRHLPPAAEAFDELPQRAARLGGQFVSERDCLRRAVERDALSPRNAMHALHRGVADAAFRRVDDALEGEVIVGRGDDLEVGKRIAHFGAFVEARAADDAVGHAKGNEPVFEGAHLERGAHQDRHVVQLLALALEVLDVLADDAGFLVAIPVGAHGHGLAVLAVGVQRLAQPALVLGDEARSGAQDLWGGAIVALQPDHLGAGKILLEAQDVVDFRPAPAIDRLVVIAHAADVLVALREKPQPQVLRHVGVLVFVHQHVFEAALILLQHVRVLLEDAQHLEQQVAEVGGVHHLQPLLVFGIELAAQSPMAKGRGFAGGHTVGRQPAVLPAVDEGGQLPGGPALFVHVMGFEQLLQEPDLVVGVEDREARA